MEAALTAFGRAICSEGDAAAVGEEEVAYPFVPIPAHIGVTLFAPAVYPSFDELFSLTEKSDFEAILFPRLAAEHEHRVPSGRFSPASTPSAIPPDDRQWRSFNDLT